ncbi:MAG: hypothetical protein LBJ67_00735 [Planctomycetaceae bacterium]|jgi:hypothetical protein|nr:hypothetical protein [Planctomycetaceae bacterium]
MPSSRVTFLDNIQIVPQYEQLRATLFQEKYALHLSKPLAFWALPTDRRLPLVLLNRSLGELLNIPFEEICRTPSIGEKKVLSYLTLLTRATNTKAEDIPEKFCLNVPIDNNSSLFIDEDDVFLESANVSEIQWQTWQNIIIEYGLQNEKLGRLCPTLKELTHVVWNNTFEDYCSKSLTEIREIPTHGEKRITAIMKIFHNICSIVSNLKNSKHFVMRLIPRNIDHVENWSIKVLLKRGMPKKSEIDDNYIQPLLEQMKIDASEQIYELILNRIGLQGEVTSIRQASRILKLARARVYQLLNEINDITLIRWPNGRLLTSLLRNKFLRDTTKEQYPNPEFARFHAAAELFFPWGRREDAGDDYFFQFREIDNDFAQEKEENEFSNVSKLNESFEERIPKTFPVR